MTIEYFEEPVSERSLDAMCVHAKAILDTLNEIPTDELNTGDIMLGQLAENLRQVIHAVPIVAIAHHRAASPVDLSEWL